MDKNSKDTTEKELNNDEIKTEVTEEHHDIKEFFERDEVEEISQLEDNVADNYTGSKTKMRRNFYSTLAVFFSIMAIIGVISTVNFAVSSISRLLDNTDFKNELAQFLYPVVIVDCPPFAEGEQLPNEVMLITAAWDVIINGNKTSYNNNFGYMTVPASDLEKHATSIFGTGLEFEHQTLGDINLYFDYIEDTNSYIIPQSPNFLPYSPIVEEIITISEKKIDVIVGYYPPSQAWSVDNSDAIPDKYMKYTLLEENQGEYVVVAIEYVSDYVETTISQ